MSWAKTKNPWSRDATDPAAEENIIKTGMLAGAWGSVPASSKELDVTERLLTDLTREGLRAQGPSGWYTRGTFVYSGGFPANTFRMDLSRALVDGLPIFVAGVALASDIDNVITLNSPPGSGTHDDLVFLEIWLAEVPGSTTTVPVSTNKPSTTTVYKYGNVQYGGTNIQDDINEVDFEIRRRIQIQYRIRVQSDVDFGTYPKGINDPTVLAQGGAGSPTAVQFAADAVDAGLFTAGNGSVTHQSTLATLDGYVLAVPIARIARTVAVTVITGAEVTDLRTTSGALNYLPRDGSLDMTDSLNIVSAANSSNRRLYVQGKTAGGTSVEGELLADLTGKVRVGSISNHDLEFFVNSTLHLILTAAGLLTTPSAQAYRHDGNCPRFESSEQTISDGTKTTIAHGLPALPKSCWVTLRCKTTEHGYAANDETPMFGHGAIIVSAVVNETGISVSMDDTNVYMTVSADPVHVYHATTGVLSTITNGNWRAIVRADP